MILDFDQDDRNCCESVKPDDGYPHAKVLKISLSKRPRESQHQSFLCGVFVCLFVFAMVGLMIRRKTDEKSLLQTCVLLGQNGSTHLHTTLIDRR